MPYVCNLSMMTLPLMYIILGSTIILVLQYYSIYVYLTIWLHVNAASRAPQVTFRAVVRIECEIILCCS